MCLSTVYKNEIGDANMLAKNVADIKVDGGKLIFTDLMGIRTVFDGSLEGYDLVVLPGGMPGAANLAANDQLINAIKKMAKEGKLVASICAGPMSLDRARLLDGRRFTCFPTRKDTIGQKGEWVDELVVRDGNVITSQGPGTTLHFAYALVDALGGDGDALRERMLYNKVCA